MNYILVEFIENCVVDSIARRKKERTILHAESAEYLVSHNQAIKVDDVTEFVRKEVLSSALESDLAEKAFSDEDINDILVILRKHRVINEK